jgi:hypothetical protein
VKISDFNLNEEDIITTDGYLSFCNTNDITYVKTDVFYTGPLIWRGKEHPGRICDISVIGHSDYPVTDKIAELFRLIFCINRNTNKQNVFGLPLGITNDCSDSPIHLIYSNKKIMVEVFSENIIKDNLAYINFNVNTFPVERHLIIRMFSGISKIGISEDTIEGRTKYLREIKSSKFVFCPRGNGIDTHRIWETLYMGSFPIVKYEETHHLFTDLPILFVNNWNEIDENYLNIKYNEMINKDWNMDKLKQSFWNKFIETNYQLYV